MSTETREVEGGNSGLLDTRGRNNRKLPDRSCPQCGQLFRPPRAGSRYCSRPCAWANAGKHQQPSPEVWWVNQKGYIEGRVTEDGQVRRVNNLEVVSHAEHTRHHFAGRTGNTRGLKLNLADSDRRARSERMRQRHAARRAALALVDGPQGIR